MNLKRSTIVVFGVTGTVGVEVLKELNKRNCFVRGVLRNTKRKIPIELNGQNNRITYIAVNLDSKEEIKRACINSDAIFLLTGTSPNQITYETNIIEVAEELKIERIVKLSAPVLPNNTHVEVGDWHRQIEKKLAKSNIDYCLLQPHSFMQNWERNTFTIKYFGKIFGVMENAKRNYVDARDVAEIAVHYLLKPENLKGEAIVISGPEAISHTSMAKRISHVTNRNVVYENISRDEYMKKLTKQAKLPTWLARHLVEIDVLAIKHPEPIIDTVEAILNRKPRIMDAYLQESRDLFKTSKWNFFT
ncbi:NmrA family transcriptional regulator [Tenacibaculum sp. Bg11-29]|uniref:NmrA family NAD(P)-binding protein n=1 Tax=Tenacibaculum sp. Bg11-29 TaxID=2058306 RepID=UPI000C31FF40|nr:NmrA family NAD(P)-binding protein [Tenacibaculum sp. Bg11-29]PKH52652.1 NmrA family transcriptional regulator [Tenacibaculum sp. Bg11-29]